MKNTTTVFANLLSLFPRSEFEKAVKHHAGDHRVRTLDCFDMVKTLIYGQVINAYSGREIETSMVANAKKLYHCGMHPVSRTTLCDALAKRNPAIFQAAFEALVVQARHVAGSTKTRFRNPLRIIDATTIELCIARCNWATYRTTKGAIKLHVTLNGDSLFPQQVRLTTGNVADVTELSHFTVDPHSIVTMDRGYIDYKQLSEIDLSGSTFVVRMKRNCQYTTIKATHFKNAAVRRDARIRLDSCTGMANYPKEVRQIFYHDDEHDRDYVFLTNNFEIPAQEIADVYKARWQVELFFKWLKQNLKIKSFWGTSQKAVYTQIWVALIVFMLVWLHKTLHQTSVSMQRILQILKTTIMSSGTIHEQFIRPQLPKTLNTGQLSFVGFKN